MIMYTEIESYPSLGGNQNNSADVSERVTDGEFCRNTVSLWVSMPNSDNLEPASNSS